MPRERTAKRIAQRVDIGYYKKPHPFRRWRNFLFVLVPAVALLWLGSMAAMGREDAYSSGPVSRSHAVFGDACATCHIEQKGVFREHAPDTACLACHDAPTHNAQQVMTPTCASCHLEHQGAMRLAHTSDVSCLECHSDLRMKAGEPKIIRAVGQFNKRHPEFAPLREGKGDPGRLKFNHKAHMRDDLRAPDGTMAKLDCADCHRPLNVKGPWRFGRSAEGTAEARQAAREMGWALPAMKPSADVSGGYMAPLQYEQNCAVCHNLQFDARFPEPAPHDKPEAVRAFLETKFREYIRQNPQEVGRTPAAPRQLPARANVVPAVARSAAEWVEHRVADAEGLLYLKSCKHCHEVEFGQQGALPKVAEPQVPVRWLQKAIFDHEPHRMLDCDSCHNASASGEAKDVLIPGIASCQTCHQGGDKAAENRCFECHQYHPWGEQKHVKGRFRIEELTSGKALRARPQGD